jgi:hypothetical protein
VILLNKGQTAETITVTLNEKRTLDSGYYLFVFTNILTRQIVNKIYSFIDDTSDFQDRYNEFEINTDTVFGDYPIGQWGYTIYEQASSSNTVVTGLTEVERGIMMLKPSSEFEFESYNESTTFKAYNG